MPDDKGLNDAPTETTSEPALADVMETREEPPPTPESFDLSALLSGMRPYQRSVKLNLRGYLTAQMDAVVDQIDSAPAEQNVDGLIDEFERLRDEFNEGTWFTVEQRSQEWITHFRDEKEKELGLKRVKKELSADDTMLISLYQLADQIVVPSISVEQLQAIERVTEAEFIKLLLTVRVVNEQLAKSAEVLTRDFSERRSTKNATTAS